MSADNSQTLAEIRLRRDIFNQLGTSGNHMQDFERIHEALVQTLRDRRRVTEMVDAQLVKLRMAEEAVNLNDARTLEYQESIQKNIRDLMADASAVDRSLRQLEQRIEQLYEIASDEETRRFEEIDEQSLRKEARALLENKLDTFQAQATHEQRSLLPGASPSTNIRDFKKMIYYLALGYAEAVQLVDNRAMDFFSLFLADPVAPVLRRAILFVAANLLAGDKTFEQAVGNLMPRLEPFLTDDAFAHAIVCIYWNGQKSREARRAYKRLVEFIKRDRASGGFARSTPIFIEAVTEMADLEECLTTDKYENAVKLSTFFGDMLRPVVNWLKFYLKTIGTET